MNAGSCKGHEKKGIFGGNRMTSRNVYEVCVECLPESSRNIMVDQGLCQKGRQ